MQIQVFHQREKAAEGLLYCVNQEKYLKVFLDNDDVPINNTANGANASSLVYIISETAKLNKLRPYYYFKYLLTELPKHCDEKGNMEPEDLDYLMPWSESLPDECRKPRCQYKSGV